MPDWFELFLLGMYISIALGAFGFLLGLVADRKPTGTHFLTRVTCFIIAIAWPLSGTIFGCIVMASIGFEAGKAYSNDNRKA